MKKYFCFGLIAFKFFSLSCLAQDAFNSQLDDANTRNTAHYQAFEPEDSSGFRYTRDNHKNLREEGIECGECPSCDLDCHYGNCALFGGLGCLALGASSCIIGAAVVPPILAYCSNISTGVAAASGIVNIVTGNVFAAIPAWMYWYRFNYEDDPDEVLRDWNIGLTAVNTCLYSCYAMSKCCLAK